MEEKIKKLLENWRKRNISGFYCADKETALTKILGLVPLEATVGISGSQTLSQLGIANKLEARGNRVFNQYKNGLAKEESAELRKKGVQADFYLTSANAVSEGGELVFFSAYGHRIAGIANAKNVIVVCGINKLTPDIKDALNRARQYAAPLNCKRLDWNTPCLKDGICRKEICLFPGYNRMCCQVLIIEAEALTGRLEVVLVNDTLGF